MEILYSTFCFPRQQPFAEGLLFSSPQGKIGQGFTHALSASETNLLSLPEEETVWWDFRQVSWQLWGPGKREMAELVRWGFLSWEFDGGRQQIGPLDGYQFPEGLEAKEAFSFLRRDARTHRSLFCYNTGVIRTTPAAKMRIKVSFASVVTLPVDVYLRVTVHGDSFLPPPEGMLENKASCG